MMGASDELIARRESPVDMLDVAIAPTSRPLVERAGRGIEPGSGIADALAELKTPVGGREVVAGVMAKTTKRSASWPFLLVPIVAISLAVVVLVSVPGMPSVGSTSNAGAGFTQAASQIALADIAPCGSQLTTADVASVVQLAAARDFGTVFPVYKDRLPEEANTALSGYVVVLNGRYPIAALRRAAPAPGQTWPPEPTLAPGHSDVCLVIPGGTNGTGLAGRPLVVIYADIDTSGFRP